MRIVVIKSSYYVMSNGKFIRRFVTRNDAINYIMSKGR